MRIQPALYARGRAGRTALHLACISNQGEVARVLLKHGAISNSTDRFMKKPMQYAVARGAKGCVDALRMHGVPAEEALERSTHAKKRVLLPEMSEFDSAFADESAVMSPTSASGGGGDW